MSLTNHPIVRQFFDRHRNHASTRAPVAAFDCDGTVIGGDIGEAMLYHQIEQFWFRVSPADVWTDHPGRAELDRRFSLLAGLPGEERRQHPEFAPFAETILSWYFGQINDGKVIKSCTDIVRLFTGFREADVRAFARLTFETERARPRGRRLLGLRHVPGGVRFLREAVDLLKEAQARGMEIWANSGSSGWSVEPVFAALGVASDRVIGIELESAGGVVTPREVLPIPIREGKVEAMKARNIPMPVLVASDSRNDIPLFRFSADLKVRINSRGRSTEEFFQAYGSPADDTWITIDQPTLSEQP
jgi:phosphoserine phosphatase